MAEFDPYRRWLGIPSDQRPPTYYQLLGIAPGEDDADVIEEAVIRQTAHVRSYQLGPHATEATQLLNEIAQARAVLRNPAKRREYDASLNRTPRKATAGRADRTEPTTSTSPRRRREEDEDEETPLQVRRKREDRSRTEKKPFANRGVLLGVAGSAGGAAVVLIVLLVVLPGRGPQEKDDHEQAARPATQETAPVAKEKPPAPKKTSTLSPAPPPNPASTEPRPSKQVTDAEKPPPPKREQAAPPVPNGTPVQFTVQEGSPTTGQPVSQEIGGLRTYRTDVAVSSAVLSPDGRVLSVAASRAVILFDAQTGVELRRLTFPSASDRKNKTFRYPGAVFTPDGRSLLVSYAESPGTLWEVDPETGLERRRLEAPQAVREFGVARRLAISPDGRYALSMGRTSYLWDLQAGQVIHTLETADRSYQGTFFADSRQYFGLESNAGDLLVIRDLPSSEKSRALQVPASGPTAFMPDFAYALLGQGKEVKVWDLNANRQAHALPPTNSTVRGVAISADGKIGLGCDSGHLYVWDLVAGTEKHRLKRVMSELGPVSFVGPRTAVVCGSSGVLMVDVEKLPTERTVSSPTETRILASKASREMPAGSLYSLVSLKDGRLLGAGTVTALVDPKTGQSRVLRPRQAGFSSGAVALAPDERWALTSTGREKGVHLWDLTSGREIPVAWANPVSVTALAISPDGKRFAVGGQNSVTVFDTQSRSELTTFKHYGPAGILFLGYLGDSQRVLAANSINIALWDPDASRKPPSIAASKPAALAVCPDGSTAVIAVESKLQIHDLSTGNLLDSVGGFTGGAQRLAVSRDGKLVAAAFGPSPLLLRLDASKLTTLGSLPAHPTRITGLAFSADGSQLVTATEGADQKLRAWSLKGIAPAN